MRARALVLLASLALVLPLGAADAASTLWSGYTIRANGKADGGFVGARLTDGKVTYRLDAGAPARATGYRKPRKVGDSRNEARAAWILSRYGAVRLADQAAAVDVATYALVSGSRLSSRRTKARLRATGRAAAVRALAKQLLTASKHRAGPYRIIVKTKPGVVGGKVSAKARVTSYTGKPLVGVPVVLQVPGVAESRRTNQRGRVSASFPATEVGLRRLSVSLASVPEWRLVVRPPKRRGASRIAIAGRRARVVARAQVAVRATPQISLVAPTAPGVAGSGLRGHFQVLGSEGRPLRRVEVALYGPFAPGTTPTCTGTPAVRAATGIAADGTYGTPAVTPARYGIYVWQVRLADSTLNEPAGACGAPTRVVSRPTVALEAKGSTKLSFSIAGLPSGYSADAVMAVHGPFSRKANVGCGRKQVGTTRLRVTRNGSYTSARIPVSAAGFYGWQLVLPGSTFSLGLTTPCRAAGSVVKIP